MNHVDNNQWSATWKGFQPAESAAGDGVTLGWVSSCWPVFGFPKIPSISYEWIKR